MILSIKINFFLLNFLFFQTIFGKKSTKVTSARAPKGDEPIIIVGGGLAGLSAALEAIDEGAKVLLFEKEKDFGGNSAKASSGVSACNTEIQSIMGIEDSKKLFYSDTMSAGDFENDAALVDIMVHESASAVDFLIKNKINLSDVNLCGGHSVPRLHWLLPPKDGKPISIGYTIIRELVLRLNEITEQKPDQLSIFLNTSVVGLVTWNEYVTGVRFINNRGMIEEIGGKAVILATGGFGNDRNNETSLLLEFAPKELYNLPTTNGQFATGDGIKMARAMGAEVIGMNNIQIHPTSFIDPKDPSAKSKFLAAEALRGKGALLLNEKGERFANELGRRDYLTQKIQQNCAKNSEINNWSIGYMIVNKNIVESFGQAAFNFYWKIKKFFTKVENVDELAKYLNCNIETLKATLIKYNKYTQNNTEKKSLVDEFNKKFFPVSFQLDEPFYVAKITPAIHYTIGGLKINKRAFVYSEFMKQSFKGLLAAGEVTGGVHGRNRLAGNGLLESVVFGRVAGRSAAHISYIHNEL